MNEVQRRVVAGRCSEMLGRGGKSAVAALGDEPQHRDQGRAARSKPGSSRPIGSGPSVAATQPPIDKQPGLLEALDELVASRQPGAIRCRCCAGPRSRPTNLADDLCARASGLRRHRAGGS